MGIYQHLHKLGSLKPVGLMLYVFVKRALPIMFFAVLLGYGSILIDRSLTEERSGEDYIKYTAFAVTNARAGEDVYFKVCRDHEKNYNIDGVLSVYVYRNADSKERPVQVYSQDINDNIVGECNNKVIKAKDFSHTPGTYKMGFCVNFTVKYDIRKTVCKESNIYKIYEQPADIDSQIRSLQQQLETLQARRSSENIGIVQQPSNSAVPQSALPPPSHTSSPSASNTPAPAPASPARPGSSNAGNGNSGNGTPATPANPSIIDNVRDLLRL